MINYCEHVDGYGLIVLDQKGKYSLLIREGCLYEPYVVAYNLKSCNCDNDGKQFTGYYWSQGHYFDSIEKAVDYFRSR